MRARNIKPGFFKHEALGSADPLYGIIFQGLWCLADREGRLEDRPLRIHVEVNPYRDSASTVQALGWLVQQGLVIRYSVNGDNYLQIVNFLKHQQPHIKEAKSRIPPFTNQGDVAAPDKHGANTSRAHLIPSSLIPDSLIPDSKGKTRARARESAAPAGAPPETRPRSRRKPEPELDLPAALDLDTWFRWQDYRSRIGKPIKPASLQAAADELAKFGDEQVAVVQQSIAAGWQGLFPLKAANGTGSGGRKSTADAIAEWLKSSPAETPQ